MVHAVKEEKLKMTAKMEEMQIEMTRVKVKARSDIIAALEERDQKEKEAEEARKALQDILENTVSSVVISSRPCIILRFCMFPCGILLRLVLL